MAAEGMSITKLDGCKLDAVTFVDSMKGCNWQKAAGQEVLR